MKKYLLFASVLLAFASCANDNYLGTEDEQRLAQGEKPITFGFDVPAATRAEVTGATAAGKLNNQFIVYAEKNETDATAPAAGNLVFPNYKVTYGANTAYTTTSNTKDWEYVGLKWDATDAANVKMGSTAVTTNDQTIKYWDYGASNYVFTAVSAKPADITSGAVKITKTTAGTTDEYDKGYSVAVTDMADLNSLYFADRVKIVQSNDKDRTQVNKYGGNVTFTFRNGLSQVRVGMYETIPGYEVKVTKFYYATTANPAFDDMTTGNTTNFVANVPCVSPDVANSKTSVAGTFTVKYYPKNTENDAASISNHPTISFTPTNSADSKNYMSLGNGVCNTTLKTTSATPTYDQAGGAFTTVFPQEANKTNLKLKIDYQLSNTVTGETISIIGKTAEVPSKYLQWKPNFKYTYLFKITDDDLYPITFDAVVIEAEDGQAEYITTVSEPSITTFGVGSNGKYLVNGNEYANGNDIYATIMDGSAVVDPASAKINIYKNITAQTGFTVTEASLAEAIQEISAKNHKVSYTLDNDIKSNVTTVPGEDGKNITIKAIKLDKSKLESGKYYAIEYVKTAATYKFVVVPIAESAFDATKTELNLYTAANDAAALESSATFSSTATYYKKVVDNPGVYAYKVIKVQ